MTGAAAQSVIAAMFDAPAPSAAERARAAAAAMGKPPQMSDEEIDAHLAARATSRAWVFERRKAQVARNLDVEDAILLD